MTLIYSGGGGFLPRQEAAMSSSTTQVFVPMVRTEEEEEEPHRQLAHSTPSSPETAQLHTAQHQFVIFIVFATSPAQPSPAQPSPAQPSPAQPSTLSAPHQLSWGPATHFHKHDGHWTRESWRGHWSPVARTPAPPFWSPH